jgi:hypothetical protein
MSNQNCLVCFQNIPERNFELDCKCSICQECFTEWIITNNKSTLFTTEEFYSCPNFNCGVKIEKQWVYENISQKDIEELNQVLLNKYITNSLDVQKCPSKDCNYSGFLNDYQKTCKKEFICDNCETKWSDRREIASSTLMYYFKTYIYNYEQVNEDLSEIRIKLSSRPCYHCGKQVSKIQGCNHITCFCRKEFCYVCLGNWYVHDSQVCLTKRDISGVIMFLLVIAIIIKTVVSYSIIKWAIWNIFWIFLINISVIGLLILNYFIFYFTVGILRWNPCFVGIGLVLVQGSIIYWNYISDYDSFASKLWVLGIELVIMFGGSVIGSILLCLKYICRRR